MRNYRWDSTPPTNGIMTSHTTFRRQAIFKFLHLRSAHSRHIPWIHKAWRDFCCEGWTLPRNSERRPTGLQSTGPRSGCQDSLLDGTTTNHNANLYFLGPKEFVMASHFLVAAFKVLELTCTKSMLPSWSLRLNTRISSLPVLDMYKYLKQNFKWWLDIANHCKKVCIASVFLKHLLRVWWQCYSVGNETSIHDVTLFSVEIDHCPPRQHQKYLEKGSNTFWWCHKCGTCYIQKIFPEKVVPTSSMKTCSFVLWPEFVK